jgi:hypothetical protein
MSRHVVILLLVLSGITASIEATEPPNAEAAPEPADTFEREALTVLSDSHALKRSVVVHFEGRTVTGIVVAIGPDVVIMTNREHGRIVVRRDRIDAIEGD